MDASFYSEQIELIYREYLLIYLGFLAITIAFLGLLGMVIYTSETRMKELSIRKVFEASTVQLTYTVGRGFLVLLLVSEQPWPFCLLIPYSGK